jgi:hypothetical protein
MEKLVHDENLNFNIHYLISTINLNMETKLTIQVSHLTLTKIVQLNHYHSKIISFFAYIVFSPTDKFLLEVSQESFMSRHEISNICYSLINLAILQFVILTYLRLEPISLDSILYLTYFYFL